MIKCKICDMEFKTNAGGDLTKHLLNQHNISFENYIILTEYDNIAPLCKCGFCSDRPEFYRGKFKKYAYGHTSTEWHHKNYIQKYGMPVCEHCGIEVEFRSGRKVFPRFCSTTCSGTHNKDTIISKMQPKIIEKYKNPEYKKKMSLGIKNRFLDPAYYTAHVERTTKYNSSEQSRKLKSINSKKRWSDQAFKIKQSKLIKYATNLPLEQKRRSQCQIERLKDPEIRKMYVDILHKISKRFSKLHLRMIDSLQLRELGFIGEYTVGGYCVDEIHLDRKIIIEINGDYIHANPKYYSANDIIVLIGNSYTAEMKWEKDRKRQTKLESLGYTVFVIWESDTLDDIKEKLTTLLDI
jgi:very-short-patch-repair endonuclease